MEDLNWLDAVLLAALVISALVGLARGLVREVLSLLAWFVSIYVAWYFAELVSQRYVHQFINDNLISYIAAFGGVFLLALFAIGLLNLLLAQLFSRVGLSGVDRVLGMVFGVVRGLLIGALLVFFGSFTPLMHEPMWQNSQLAPTFMSLAQWGGRYVPDYVGRFVRSDASKAVLRPYESVAREMALETERGVIRRPNITPEENFLPQQQVAPLSLESVQDLDEPTLRLESVQ